MSSLGHIVGSMIADLIISQLHHTQEGNRVSASSLTVGDGFRAWPSPLNLIIELPGRVRTTGLSRACGEITPLLSNEGFKLTWVTYLTWFTNDTNSYTSFGI